LAPPCENGTVEIFNMLGKQVYSVEITEQKSVIDSSDQPEGIYIATLQTGREAITKKSSYIKHPAQQGNSTFQT
jgi:hypothetical protein